MRHPPTSSGRNKYDPLGPNAANGQSQSAMSSIHKSSLITTSQVMDYEKIVLFGVVPALILGIAALIGCALNAMIRARRAVLSKRDMNDTTYEYETLSQDFCWKC